MLYSDSIKPVEGGTGERGMVLVVDDEPTSRALLTRWLEHDGFAVESYENAEDCLSAFSHVLPDAVCLDLGLPGMNGIEALTALRARAPRLPVVMLTATRELETVVAAMQAGAYDYITKPVDRTKLCTVLRNAVDKRRMSLRLGQLEREVKGGGFSEIHGQSQRMHEVFRELDRVADSDITVLVHGESGTGKELIARAIHEHSGRKNGPFVSLNCAAIPESLQESEFFGHERGTFTGAQAQRKGRFELAHEGTLFLDEVAELSLALQAKLLRVLQERTFTRVGGTVEVRSDFRLVAATHRDLTGEVEAGRFRQDLYFRIAVFELEVPPLRDRGDDALLLAQHFLDEFGKGRQLVLSPEAAQIVSTYRWPGNVRELQNIMQRALVLCEGDVVRPQDLPAKLRDELEAVPPPPVPQVPPLQPRAGVATPVPTTPAGGAAAGEGGLRMEDLERKALEEALARNNGNVTAAVKQLGIGRTTIYRLMKKYGIRT